MEFFFPDLKPSRTAPNFCLDKKNGNAQENQWAVERAKGAGGLFSIDTSCAFLNDGGVNVREGHPCSLLLPLLSDDLTSLLLSER